MGRWSRTTARGCCRSTVSENGLLSHLYIKNDLFTKTGSRQTQGKFKDRLPFSLRPHGAVRSGGKDRPAVVSIHATREASFHRCSFENDVVDRLRVLKMCRFYQDRLRTVASRPIRMRKRGNATLRGCVRVNRGDGRNHGMVPIIRCESSLYSQVVFSGHPEMSLS